MLTSVFSASRRATTDPDEPESQIKVNGIFLVAGELPLIS